MVSDFYKTIGDVLFLQNATISSEINFFIWVTTWLGIKPKKLGQNTIRHTQNGWKGLFQG